MRTGTARSAWEFVNTRNQYGRKPLEDVGRRVGKAVERLDEETERLVAYLNNEVVPAVREHSSRGLRKAAQTLAQFAEYLESTQKPK